jgi:tight adherence protein B
MNLRRLPGTPFAIGALAGIAVVIADLLAMGNLFLALCLGFVVASAVHSAMISRIARKAASAGERTAMAIELIAAQLTSGVTFVEALQNAVFDAPPNLRTDLELLQAIFESEHSLDEKVQQAESVLGCREGDLAFELVFVAARLGDDQLVETLQSISASMRRNQGLQRELSARQGWVLGSARLAQAAPWVIVVLLCARQETADAFQQPLGVAVLGFGLLLSLIAQRFIVAGARLPIGGRIYGAAK